MNILLDCKTLYNVLKIIYTESTENERLQIKVSYETIEFSIIYDETYYTSYIIDRKNEDTFYLVFDKLYIKKLITICKCLNQDTLTIKLENNYMSIDTTNLNIFIFNNVDFYVNNPPIINYSFKMNLITLLNFFEFLVDMGTITLTVNENQLVLATSEMKTFCTIKSDIKKVINLTQESIKFILKVLPKSNCLCSVLVSNDLPFVINIDSLTIYVAHILG